MRRSVPAMLNTPSRYSMSAAAASNSAAASSRAFTTVRSEATLILRARRAIIEAFAVGKRERLVHDQLELPAVIGLFHRIGVRHLLGLDHVAAAQLDVIDAALVRGRVHQALDDIDRFGPARA